MCVLRVPLACLFVRVRDWFKRGGVFMGNRRVCACAQVCMRVYTDGNTAPKEVRRFSVCASRLPALRQEREKLRIRFQTEAAAAWSPNTTHTQRFKTQTHFT